MKTHQVGRSGRRTRGGFMLIELLVIIAIIAILLGMLLPVVQKVRVESAAESAGNYLEQIDIALHNYNERFGEFPPSLEHIGLADQFDGYDWAYTVLPEIPDQGFLLKGTPAAPGKTGNVIFTLNAKHKVKVTPVPEWRNIHRRMFENIRRRGLDEIARLMEFESADEAATEAECLAMSMSARGAAFDMIDADSDGRATLREILALGGEESPLDEFIAFVRDEMALGQGGEDLSRIPGVSLADLEPPRRGRR